jgi:glutamine synthetase
MGSISTQKEQTSPLNSFLTSHPTIRLIRYEYLDVSSILRCITLTATHALSLGPSPHKISAVALDMLPNTAFGPNFHCLGTDDLYPDWSSLRVAKYVEGIKGNEEVTASVMCYVRGHHTQYDPYYSCPRSILQKALSTAKNDYGMTFLVGCEIEFFLLDPSSSSSSSIIAASHSGGQYTALSLRHSPILSLLEEVVFTLQESNIAVETFHGEGEGYEISLGPLPPMAAVDTLVYAREAIYSIAARRGYRATMYPIPFPEAHGVSVMSSIGAHTHFSIDNPAGDMAQHFLAGLLETLPGLCAFGMPHHDSYGRVGSSIGQAGKWVAYGTEVCMPTSHT